VSRLTGIRAGAATLMAGRIFSAACGLVQVPVALAHLGTEAFGLWMALAGVLWTLSVLDGGLGYALQNRLAHLIAGGRESEVSALLRKGVRWLSAIAAGVVIVGAPLAFALPWARWLGVADSRLEAQTPAAVATAVVAAAALLPLALSARLAAARQETWLTGLWTALGSAASLLAVLLAVYLELSLTGFVAAAALMPVVLHAGLAAHLAVRRCAPSRRQTGPAATVDTRGLLRESALFALPQISAALVGSFVPTLVALFAGPLAVAPFVVLQRLFGLVLQLNTLGLQPTWPAYTHAAARGDAAAARRILRVSLSLTAGGFVLPLLLIAPFTRAVLGLWLGSRAPEVSTVLIWMVAGWNAVQCLGQPPAMLLNGLGRHASMAALGWINLFISLLLCFQFGPRWGAAGVVAALALPYVALNLPVIAWQARRGLAAIGGASRP
jgi:O-antigen/teichoic acid export membrane protein